MHLEVLTTEPAFQLYTGKYVDVAEREDGSVKKSARGGFCVEPSRYVDAVNRDEWRAMVVVKKGEVYGSKIVYRGWKAEEAKEVEVGKGEAVAEDVAAAAAEKEDKLVGTKSKKDKRMSMKAIKDRGGKCIIS